LSRQSVLAYPILSPAGSVALFPVAGALGEYVTARVDSAVPVPEGVDNAMASMMLVNPLIVQMLLHAAEEAWAGDEVAQKLWTRF
jgi:NADPH:quinone reductase-like Zn-dependent oxidoreductase